MRGVSWRWLHALLLLGSLGGCVYSDEPLIETDAIDQPFGRFTVFERLSQDRDTKELKSAGRFSVTQTGSSYRVRNIDDASFDLFTPYNGAGFVASRIGSYDAWILETRSSDGPGYQYFALWKTAGGDYRLRLFSDIYCWAIPHRLVAALKPQAVSKGCTVASLDGLKEFAQLDWSYNYTLREIKQ